MQDLPNQAAQSVGDGPNRSLIAQAGQQTAEHGLKMASLGPDRCVRRLRQNPPHRAVPFRGRRLWFSSALSFSPGQIPTQEAKFRAEGKLLAPTPTSAIAC